MRPRLRLRLSKQRKGDCTNSTQTNTTHLLRERGVWESVTERLNHSHTLTKSIRRERASEWVRVGRERRNERVEPHVAVGVRAKPSAVCVCVCASLTVCVLLYCGAPKRDVRSAFRFSIVPNMLEEGSFVSHFRILSLFYFVSRRFNFVAVRVLRIAACCCCCWCSCCHCCCCLWWCAIGLF